MSASGTGGAPPPLAHRERFLGFYFALGVLFGIVLIKGELASWFRIEEALRFKGPYLYLVFASALAVAAPGFAVLKRQGRRALTGEPITIQPKVGGAGIRYVAGSVAFGVGWGVIGICPGPLFALLGAGVGVMAAVIAAAVGGTWVYGWLRPILPH